MTISVANTTESGNQKVKKKRYIPQIVKPKGKEWREEEEQKKGRKPIHTSMLRKTLTRRGAQPDWRKTVAPQGLCGGGWQEQRQQKANRCKITPDICRQKEQRKKIKMTKGRIKTQNLVTLTLPTQQNLEKHLNTHMGHGENQVSASQSSQQNNTKRAQRWVRCVFVCEFLHGVFHTCEFVIHVPRACGAWLHVHQMGEFSTLGFFGLSTLVFSV